MIKYLCLVAFNVSLEFISDNWLISECLIEYNSFNIWLLSKKEFPQEFGPFLFSKLLSFRFISKDFLLNRK